MFRQPWSRIAVRVRNSGRMLGRNAGLPIFVRHDGKPVIDPAHCFCGDAVPVHIRIRGGADRRTPAGHVPAHV